jgi:NAD(P)-dependent dehydrogenase (short-subunit alcohol dehydrogenase family)
MDLKGRGIRVNVVSPGPVPTPGYNNFGMSKEKMAGFLEAMTATIPLGRVGVPDEIARAVVFLASEDSAFVNAVELFVDGGASQV